MTSDGSVVARKDYVVLPVDASASGGDTSALTSGSGVPTEIVAVADPTCRAGDRAQ